MTLTAYLLTFIGGTFVGSFLNVISDRIDTEESIFYGRSRCDKCKKTLAPLELIPVLSFLIQGGKCKKCGVKLSYMYPLAEILTGAAFALAAYVTGLFITPTNLVILTFFYLLVVFSVYVVLILTDLKFRLLPNRIVIPTIFFVLGYIVLSYTYALAKSYFALKNDDFGRYLLEAGLWNSRFYSVLQSFGVIIISTFVIFMFFWFLIFITKGRGMGGGDLKLSILIGLFNGFPNNILSIFLGFFLGAVISVGLILLKKKTMKDTIPFGPFLILGSIIGFVYGTQLLNWYFRLFNS